MGDKKRGPDFSDLVKAIRKTHEQCTAHAGRAVNVSLTLRNWMIGRHISEFEMNGADRAVYGERLLKVLSTELRKVGVGGSGPRQLYGFLAFYRAYPKILRSVSAEFLDLVHVSAIQPRVERKVRTVSAQFEVDTRDLLSKLSYSHFELLVAIEEPIKRTFYEIERRVGMAVT